MDQCNEVVGQEVYEHARNIDKEKKSGEVDFYLASDTFQFFLKKKKKKEGKTMEKDMKVQ